MPKPRCGSKSLLMMTAAHVGMQTVSTVFLAFAILLLHWRENPMRGMWALSLLPCAAYPVCFVGYFAMYCVFYEWWSTPRWRSLDWWLAAIGCVEVLVAIWLCVRYQLAAWASV